MRSIADVIEFARSLAGLDADPKCPEKRAAYLSAVAFGETPARAESMSDLSSCELTMRRILFEFIDHPRLIPPYVNGRCGADLLAIAQEAGAAFASSAKIWHLPAPGQILIVGGGAAFGGTEHAWMMLEALSSPYDTEGAVLGLDGGMRDAHGFEEILEREHTIRGGWDATEHGSRLIRWILDTEKILERFSRPD